MSAPAAGRCSTHAANETCSVRSQQQRQSSTGSAAEQQMYCNITTSCTTLNPVMYFLPLLSVGGCFTCTTHYTHTPTALQLLLPHYHIMDPTLVLLLLLDTQLHTAPL